MNQGLSKPHGLQNEGRNLSATKIQPEAMYSAQNIPGTRREGNIISEPGFSLSPQQVLDAALDEQPLQAASSRPDPTRDTREEQ